MNCKRINYLDSLRGIASVLVIFNHWAILFMPGLYFIEQSTSAFERFWRNTPLNVITNGDWSVQLFFVLSGLLITMKIYNNLNIKSDGLKYVTKKFISVLKLIIPGVLLPFILMKCGLMFHLKALSVNSILSYCESYNNFQPTFKNLLMDVFNTIFTSSSYNGPLWTLHYELIGSIIITLSATYVYQNVEKGWKSILSYVLILAPFAYMNSHFCPFFFGSIVYDIYYQLNSLQESFNGFTLHLKLLFKNKFFIVTILILSIYCASINTMPLSGMWLWLLPVQRISTVIRSAGVAGLILLLMLTEKMQNCLDCKLLLSVGRISPYIYIYHWPIMLSLGCCSYYYSYVQWHNHVVSSFIALLLTILATLLISVLHRFLIDKN